LNTWTGHFSRASESIVWFVYAKVPVVTDQASSQPISSSSTNILINSATATAGWVSFIWIATYLSRSYKEWPEFLKVLNMLYIPALVKKYCCFNLKIFPVSAESSGYKTDDIASTEVLYSTAFEYSPLLKIWKLNALVTGSALHNLRVFTVLFS